MKVRLQNWRKPNNSKSQLPDQTSSSRKQLQFSLTEKKKKKNKAGAKTEIRSSEVTPTKLTDLDFEVMVAVVI